MSIFLNRGDEKGHPETPDLEAGALNLTVKSEKSLPETFIFDRSLNPAPLDPP